MSFRIHLDETICTGHGRCYSLAPALFDADDVGRGVLLATELDDEHRGAAETAVANCPERAISISEAS